MKRLLCLLMAVAMVHAQQSQFYPDFNRPEYSVREDPFFPALLDDAKQHFLTYVERLRRDGFMDAGDANAVTRLFIDLIERPEDPRPLFYSSIEDLTHERVLTQDKANIVRRSFDQTVGMLYVETPVTHDAERWKSSFIRQGPNNRQWMVTAIVEETRAAIRNGYYSASGKLETLDRAKILFMRQNIERISYPKVLTEDGPYDGLRITVSSRGPLEIANRLKVSGQTPVICVSSNPLGPSGRYTGSLDAGMTEQEGELLAASTYFLAYDRRFNPQLPQGEVLVPEFGCVFTPDVALFRSPQEDGYAFLTPSYFPIIAAAPYNYNGEIGTVDAPPTLETYRRNMELKIRAVLRVAAAKGCDSVVFGAFGCGLFGNDPRLVARIFRHVLEDKEFIHAFKEVAFSIPKPFLSDFQNQLERIELLK